MILIVGKPLIAFLFFFTRNSSSGNDRDPADDPVTTEDIKLMEKITQWIIIRHTCKTKTMPGLAISNVVSLSILI